MLKRLDRYLLQEITPPFFVGLLLCTFVLLMNQILLLAELFIQKGVPFGTAARILGYLAPSLLAFAVPMAVLMGILGGMSRLAADSEVVALKTLGISFSRLLRPALLFAFAGWLATSALAMVLAPRANYRWVQTMVSSVLSRVELRIDPLEFNESIPYTVLFVQSIDRSNSWKNVFVYIGKDPRQSRLILAKRGNIHLYPVQKRATLELYDGELHATPADAPEEYSITSFRRLEEEIDVAGLFPTITSEKRVREKDIGELLRDDKILRSELVIQRRRDQTGLSAAAGLKQKLREFRSHRVEIHKKFALPFVCFLFVLIGLPLGVQSGIGGRTSGFTLSLAFILLYYVLITGGEKLALDGKMAPVWGMWGPNVVLGLIGLVLFLLARRDAWVIPSIWESIRKRRTRKKESKDGSEESRARRMTRISLRFPNVLDRYIGRKYLAIFGLVLLGLVTITVLVTFLERLDDVYRHNKPLLLLIRYVWFKTPEFLSYLFPVAVLTTTLLTLGILTKNNEVTAMKATGTSVYRLSVPLIVLSLLAGGTAFAVQERLQPAASIKAEEVWNEITEVPARSYSYLNRHWIMSQTKDRIYHYEFFEPASSSFSRMSLFDLNLKDWTLGRRIYAEKATLREGALFVQHGWARDFVVEKSPTFAVRENWLLPIPDGQTTFLKKWKEPTHMTFGELKDYTREIRDMGFEATRLGVSLQMKIAFPFICLIMALLAIPFAFSMGRKGTLVGIGLSIAIAMVYWGAVALFRSLGYVGFLAPFLAAWGPNLIFGLAGIYLFLRLRT